MRIILHADDFGFDEETTRTTIELLERGVLSSATIMSNMPATDIAMEYAAKHPEKSFGVHLTYVDGLSPILSQAEIPSLVDGNGLFLHSDVVRMKALALKIHTSDIVNESIAQINKIRSGGIKISHLDSHGHLHKFPSFLKALSIITRTTGIKKVRRVQNLFVEKPKFSPTIVFNHCFNQYICSHFKSTDYFYMSANYMDVNWSDAIYNQLDLLPDNKVCEIGVHPAFDGYKEKWRVAEYHDIISFVNKVREQGRHTVVTWNDL